MRSKATFYFEIMFLSILAKDAGMEIVKSRRKLDKIKLRRNRLNRLLKLKYNLSCKIDDYERYTRDDKWDYIEANLMSVYKDNMEAMKNAKLQYFPIKDFVKSSLADKKKIDGDVSIVFADYEEKKVVLQNLADYKNNIKTMRINILMLLIAALTLYFVIFPEKAIEAANMIKEILIWWLGIFRVSL